MFVNWVKKSLEHGKEVGHAATKLRQLRLVAVPHLPACRFASSEEMHDSVQSFREAGVRQLMVLGGNDQMAQVEQKKTW